VTRTPAPVAPGEAIRADTINALRELALQRATVVAGRGLNMVRNGDVSVLSLAALHPDWARLARITVATGTSPDLASNVKYAAVEVGNPTGTIGVTGGPIAPHFGRIVDEDMRVRKAAVGSPCLILRIPIDGGETVAMLALFEGSEKATFSRCTSPAARAAMMSGLGPMRELARVAVAVSGNPVSVAPPVGEEA